MDNAPMIAAIAPVCHDPKLACAWGDEPPQTAASWVYGMQDYKRIECPGLL